MKALLARAQALAAIRSQTIDSAIVYFYVVDEDGRLRGVVPTRRLLTAPPDTPVPFSTPLEEFFLPKTADIVTAARKLSAY